MKTLLFMLALLYWFADEWRDYFPPSARTIEAEQCEELPAPIRTGEVVDDFAFGFPSGGGGMVPSSGGGGRSFGNIGTVAAGLGGLGGIGTGGGRSNIPQSFPPDERTIDVPDPASPNTP